MEELITEVQALKAELTELKDLVHKGIIEPIEQDYNDRKYNEALDMWKERYGEKLSPFEEMLKATDGEDFDLMKSSYDAWNETDMDSDEWVDLLIEGINKSVEPLHKVFGTPKEDFNATIEVEGGEVKDIKADTEPEKGESTEESAAAEEEKAEEEPKAEEKELSEEEAFQKELDDAYAKMKEKRY